jgi:hypothetical protein
LEYSQIKLFAPAEDCLAYTPNDGGGEVAATERRTVLQDFSSKFCKYEMNKAYFSSVSFSAIFHFFVIRVAVSRLQPISPATWTVS